MATYHWRDADRRYICDPARAGRRGVIAQVWHPQSQRPKPLRSLRFRIRRPWHSQRDGAQRTGTSSTLRCGSDSRPLGCHEWHRPVPSIGSGRRRKALSLEDVALANASRGSIGMTSAVVSSALATAPPPSPRRPPLLSGPTIHSLIPEPWWRSLERDIAHASVSAGAWLIIGPEAVDG